MDPNATALRPITTLPIDMRLVAAAGEPGTPGRVAVYHALAILNRQPGPAYTPRARGPYSYDFLGFVREVVSEAMADCHARAVPLDDLAIYPTGFDPGLPVDALRSLIVDGWGMREISFHAARPGDVLVFAMPGAHAGIKLPDIVTGPTTTEPRMASVVWGQPGGQQYIAGQWAKNACTAFTWGEQ